MKKKEVVFFLNKPVLISTKYSGIRRSGIITEIIGRNAYFNNDWIWIPDIVKIEELKDEL